jgi:hypothetical protein
MNQPSGAGRLNSKILSRANETLDEANALLEPHDFAYVGKKGAWQVDLQQIAYKTYLEPMYGIVVPRAGELRFRPLSPGMLAEGMARRIDRWINVTENLGHSWQQGAVEQEHYNGLMNVLSHQRFNGIVDGELIDHLVVIIGHLALGTSRPDRSAAFMLKALEKGRLDMRGPGVIAHQLKRALVKQRLLHADGYNEIMHDLMHGHASVMNRQEFYSVYELMVSIYHAANALLDCPDFYADNTVEWARVKAWMSRRGFPPIICDDGIVTTFEGMQSEETAIPLLLQVQRVLL